MAATHTPEVTTRADGRRARAVRSRDAVVEAILDLINERGSVPSVNDVAERAGVSVRSLFRYFDDLESLHVAAIDRHVERVVHLFAPPASAGSLTRRIDALINARATLFETISPVRQVAEGLRAKSPAISRRLAEGREELQAQVVEQFEVETAGLSVADRRVLLAALEVATAWPTWNALRVDQGCSKAQASAVMRRTVRALLADR